LYKIGIGFDIHQLKDDHVLKIGGVEIPHSKGLFGHSDADVLVHAVMDSILGALALGDIGQHFPDTSSKYKNANSLELLYQVHELAKNKGYFVSNLDCIVIAEKPKISTYISKMRENLAIKLETNLELISVKAKTSERLGFVGREEGIASQAVVLLKSSI
tara:strand:- start:352 stop:831 length:480 start_codon:yes stop_codon:yes gene_type:complete